MSKKTRLIPLIQQTIESRLRSTISSRDRVLKNITNKK
jgi:hypothetical protein